MPLPHNEQRIGASRLIRAQQRIIPIDDFLARYQRWLANADADHCDFALGNPQEMPLPDYVSTLRAATTPRDKDWYAYKMSEPEPREVVRTSLQALTGLDYRAENIFLTNGATGALMVAFNALIGTDDEVIYNSPPWFFYEGMILNTGGVPVAVDVNPETFDLDVAAIAKAITAKTRLVIVNSPNNPTGKVYSEDTLRALAEVLNAASARFGQPITLLSDEAYRNIVYAGHQFVSPAGFYADTLTVYTYGKTLLTPGQRLGYLALSPRMARREDLSSLMHSSQILCGWAMGSALMQHSLAGLETLTLDIKDLQRRRDALVDGLRASGYRVHRPEGAFYVTPKTPIPDDDRCAEWLAQKGVFCLPGSIVNMPGHLRLSVTASSAMVARALPHFAGLMKAFGS